MADAGSLCRRFMMSYAPPVGSVNIETVVVGGGQAGLAVGHFLAQRSREFLILESNRRIGDSWRNRWDSLRLFTPASFDGLPGMRFPAHRSYFPTKDEMAAYLESYAARFHLPVHLGMPVESLVRTDGRFLVAAGGGHFAADRVFVATGPYAAPRVPAYADQLDPGIVQLHSVDYRNPGQLQDGPALVVGAGNSGAEIALELAPRHETLLAGRDTGHIPVALGGIAYRMLGLFTVDTWPGRKLAAWMSGRGHPLIRVRPGDLVEAGVQRVPRLAGVDGGRPVLDDRRVVEVRNVVWCTGFVRDYRWIKLPVFGADGDPMHHRGVVQTQPGLYFVGLPFQSSITSHLIGGVGADARYLVRRLG
jgi:putative flavoprotein involved in K+ transport